MRLRLRVLLSTTAMFLIMSLSSVYTASNGVLHIHTFFFVCIDMVNNGGVMLIIVFHRTKDHLQVGIHLSIGGDVDG